MVKGIFIFEIVMGDNIVQGTKQGQYTKSFYQKRFTGYFLPTNRFGNQGRFFGSHKKSNSSNTCTYQKQQGKEVTDLSG